MEITQIVLKLDGLFNAKGKVLAKTILFILNLDSWQKLIKNRSIGNIGFRCSYIIDVVIDASGVIYCSCKRRKFTKAVVSFAAVFRDVTKRSPERNGCSHSDHLPFPLCFKQAIKSVNCEWCNFRAKVMWDFRVAAWYGKWEVEKKLWTKSQSVSCVLRLRGPKKEYLCSAIVPIILWK